MCVLSCLHACVPVYGWRANRDAWTCGHANRDAWTCGRAYSTYKNHTNHIATHCLLPYK